MQYTHKTHPRSRSIKIKIEPSGEVVIVTPPRFPSHRVDQFVQKNQAWINAKTSQLSQKKHHWLDDDHITIFGKKYRLKDEYSADLAVGVRISGSDVIVNPSSHPDIDTISEMKTNRLKQLKIFLKATASKYVLPRVSQLAEHMQIAFGQVTLREQKTRWGSCSSVGNLNFNWRLVHCPPAIIDYVIIHELAHRQHMDHSVRFWNLVASYDPEFRVHRGWLKRNGLALG